MRATVALVAFVMSSVAVLGADLDRLAADLKSKDAKVRLKAVEELGAAGKEALPALRQLTDATMDGNPQVAKAALVSVSMVDPVFHRRLAAYLYATAGNKAEATRSFGGLKERGQPAAGVLEAVLRAEVGKLPVGAAKAAKGGKATPPGGLTQIDATLAAATIDTLSQVKAHSPELVRAMKAIAGPENPHASLRDNAIEYLVTWAGTDEARRREVIPILRSGIEAKSPSLQCIRLAGEYGPLAAELLPLIRPLAASPSATVRGAAVEAAARIAAKKD